MCSGEMLIAGSENANFKIMNITSGEIGNHSNLASDDVICAIRWISDYQWSMYFQVVNVVGLPRPVGRARNRGTDGA